MYESRQDNLMVYPAPEGIAAGKDFSVYVRPSGTDKWKEVFCYEVKVDMHDVRKASMAYFDFRGRVMVRVRFHNYMDIYQVDIRPQSRKILPSFTEREVYFELERPENLSIEINRDRFHNLHLFAGAMEQDVPDIQDAGVKVLSGDLHKPVVHGLHEMDTIFAQISQGGTLYLGPGIHYFEECTVRIPSGINIYMAGGAVVVGSFICDRVTDVSISGRGVVYLAGFERFSSLRGVRISHSRNIRIDGITFINPPHYTLYIGGSQSVSVHNIKSFSCEGWSDGIDVMSSSNIFIENIFMRNSDDCIALYGRRWDYSGDTRNIRVRHSVLWADVAHPTNIGCHGDYDNEGNLIENIVFSDLDILEHHEPQRQCMGCLCINAGDKNTVKNVMYENIRIEHIEHGKLLDLQIICGRYNPVPGKRIENICFKDIYYDGCGEEISEIKGAGERNQIENIIFHNLVVRGKRIYSANEGNIHVGEYAYNVNFL